MNLIDLLDPDHDGAMARDLRSIRSNHSGVDEQDSETIGECLYTCPDESDHENGSPLNFSSSLSRCYFNRLERPADIDSQIKKAFQEGCAADNLTM
jgi:hypothetical protein